MRVEIIGGIGVGKTTLCRALHRSGLQCVYEPLRQNPYLGLAYKDPKKYGFYSQIAFITGNFYTASRYREREGITFLDFSTITDRAYAGLFLKGTAQALALNMIDFLEEKEGRADLYLHLVCSEETQLRRIRSRKRPHERRIGPKFISRLNACIDRQVVIAERRGDRIITVDTDRVDIEKDRDFIPELTKKVRQCLQTPHTWMRLTPANSDYRDKPPIVQYIEANKLA